MYRFVFFLFLLLYFAWAQADVLAFWCSILRGYPVVPNPWLVSALLTLVCMYSGIKLESLLRSKSVSPLWAYIFVAWLSVTLLSWPFASVVELLVLAAAGVTAGWLLICWRQRVARKVNGNASLWSRFMPAVVELLVLCLYMGIGAAATDLDHFELRTAQTLQREKPGKVQKIGKKSYAISHRLFALRCYALSCSAPKGLGHHLFAQHVPAGGSSNLLFPTDERQQLTFPSARLEKLLGDKPRNGELAIDYLRRCAYAAQQTRLPQSRQVADYYLCGLLLDRKLDLFAREIARFYPSEVASRHLPAYYAQALVYYTRTRIHPTLVYHDAAVEANLRDYQTLRDGLPHTVERVNRLRRAYGDTYWWWYTYAK